MTSRIRESHRWVFMCFWSRDLSVSKLFIFWEVYVNFETAFISWTNFTNLEQRHKWTLLGNFQDRECLCQIPLRPSVSLCYIQIHTHTPSGPTFRKVYLCNTLSFLANAKCFPSWWNKKKFCNNGPEFFCSAGINNCPTFWVSKLKLIKLLLCSGQNEYLISITIQVVWLYFGYIYFESGLRWRSRYSDWLRLDGPGIEYRWGRFSAPVQTGPESNPASCTMGIVSLSRG